MNASPFVLVVGAGPVGMVGALELSRLGMRVRLVERAPERSPLSKAVGINARTLELLEPSGVTRSLMSKGLKIPRVNLRYGDARLATVDFTRLAHRYNFMLSLPQNETECVLEDALLGRGVPTERNVELIGLCNSASSVTATLRCPNGESNVKADYVFGADGSRSTVRERMGIRFEGERYADTWSLADVRMAWPFGHEEGQLIMREDGRVVFALPMPGGRHRVIANDGDALTLLPARSRIDEILWKTTFDVGARQVERYRRGRVFLAGDAAHIHSPAGGRGMNLGIEDAAVFARRLRDGTLDGFSPSRHSIGAQVVGESDLQFRMASTGNRAVVICRNWLIRHVLGAELFQRPFRRRMAGLDHEAA